MIVGLTQLVDSNGGHIPHAHETDSREAASINT